MSGFSSGSYGYDEFATDFSYDEERNYSKPIKQPSFQDRVEAKRNALNGGLRFSKQSSRIAEPCNCIECAPELYKPKPEPEKPKAEKLESKETSPKTDPNVFYIGFDKDTVFILFIIILCVLSMVMYFKIKKLSHRLKMLTTPVPISIPAPV
jgi:hypothetical protein